MKILKKELMYTKETYDITVMIDDEKIVIRNTICSEDGNDWVVMKGEEVYKNLTDKQHDELFDLIQDKGFKRSIYIEKEDLDELRNIKNLLDEKLYDDMNLYETGAKDILNYLFDRKGIDGGLLENFKEQRSEKEFLLCVNKGCTEPQNNDGEYCDKCFKNLGKK